MLHGENRLFEQPDYGDSSASSLSETASRLEVRLGVRLLNRTTRSVANTEAGARLLGRLSFSGPFLYDPDRRNLPAPLRAFVGFVRMPG